MDKVEKRLVWGLIGSNSVGIFLVILVVLVMIGALFPDSAPATENDTIGGTSACGETVSTLVAGVDMAPTSGKLGHEEHLTGVTGTHYEGADSQPLTFAGGGAFAPHTVDQEHWYFNTQWGGWDWSPTRFKKAPRLDHSPGADEARKKVPHSKLIITSTETNKSVAVSAEESGPALWVTDRDGINAGAPPEVYKALGASAPYTGDPSDGKGAIKIGFAKDQTIDLGLCK